MKHVVVPDIHGRWQALEKLLGKLGINKVVTKGLTFWTNPSNYKIIFLGDLGDYGILDKEYSSVICFRIAMELQEVGIAQCIQSNHHDKLMRYLKGNKVKPSHGLENTIEEIKEESMDWQGELYIWLTKLPIHYKFEENGQKYICSHAYFDKTLEKILQEDNLLNEGQFLDEPRKPNEYLKATAIYGPRITHNGTERFKWWEDEAYIKEKLDENIHYIVGHLHIFKIHERFHILDCENTLVAYIPFSNQYIGVSK